MDPLPTDDDLLRRCQQGEDAALSELIRRWEARVFRLAFRVLQDAARAEDAAADALATIWARCGTWRAEAKAGTWIQRVAWRVVLDHHRRRKKWWRFWEQGAEVEQPNLELDPAAVVELQDTKKSLAHRISVAMSTLSADDRALVHWHYFEGQSLAEIAEVFGVTRDALKMRLSRARGRLRVLLENDHER